MPVRYLVSEGALDRRVGNELLVHLFDTDDVFVLNGDARIVFECVKQSSSVEDVHDAIALRVFCDAVELARLVDGALEKMVAAGILVRAAEPEAELLNGGIDH